MAWYSTGKISVTNGSKVVAGVGTAWFGALQGGWGLVGPDNRPYEIDTVDSAGAITLKRPYMGATASGQDYAAFPTMSLANDLVERLNTLIGSFQSVKDRAGAGKFENGTESAPGQTFVADQDTGRRLAFANDMRDVTGGVDRTRTHGGGFDVYGLLGGTAVQSSPTDTTPGKLLVAGAFGRGGRSINLNGVIGVSGSLNDAPSGMSFAYSVDHSDVPKTNSGGSTAGWLETKEWNTGSKLQVASILYPSREVEGQQFTRYQPPGGQWMPWVRQLNERNILGTVSQSSGVPTGAIIERGSNANGSYVRHADGTMICVMPAKAIVDITLARGPCYRSGSATSINFPASFAVAPHVAGSTSNNSTWLTFGAVYEGSAILFGNAFTTETGVNANVFAIGRWF